jgi:Aromatic-ring hydroxylase, C-terminal
MSTGLVWSLAHHHRPADALLIRPDAHIAWAAIIDEHADTARLAPREALSCSFGTPC